MVPLDKAITSSYRQSIVTMSLSATIWPQFLMQSFYIQSLLMYAKLSSVECCVRYSSVTQACMGLYSLGNHFLAATGNWLRDAVQSAHSGDS